MKKKASISRLQMAVELCNTDKFTLCVNRWAWIWTKGGRTWAEGTAFAQDGNNLALQGGPLWLQAYLPRPTSHGKSQLIISQHENNDDAFTIQPTKSCFHITVNPRYSEPRYSKFRT